MDVVMADGGGWDTRSFAALRMTASEVEARSWGGPLRIVQVSGCAGWLADCYAWTGALGRPCGFEGAEDGVGVGVEDDGRLAEGFVERRARRGWRRRARLRVRSVAAVVVDGVLRSP